MILTFIIPIAILCFVWIRNYGSFLVDNLTASISFADDHIYAGEETVLSEVIENRKRFPVPVLIIRFRIPRGIKFIDSENTSVSDYTYKKDIFSLSGMELIRRNHRVKGVKRGFYKASELESRLPSLLHFYTYGMNFGKEDEKSLGEIYVYAARTDVSDLMRPIASILGDRLSAGSIYEDPFAFASVREYTTADPMKNINWKASAKVGSLMVNTFFQADSLQAEVYLDVNDFDYTNEEDLIEESVSIAATIIEKLTKSGLKIFFAVNAGEKTPGVTVFGGPSNDDKLKRIEEFLASDFKTMEHCEYLQMIETAERRKTFDPELKDTGAKDRTVLKLYISKNIREAGELVLPAGSADEGRICVAPYRHGSEIGRKTHILT